MNYAPKRPRRFDFDLILEFLNRRLTGWVLGPGLLTFHAGVFFLTMTGLTFWNVYDNSKDFWAGDLLRRWGAVLILHAVVVVAVTIGWRLLRTADIQEASIRNWTSPLYPARPMITDGSWRPLDGAAPAPTAEPYVPPSEPQIPRQSAAMRFRAMASERVAALRGKSNEVSPQVAASWPEPPVRRDPDADELIRQFGDSDTKVEETAPVKNRRPGQARWSWVEASATSWLTRKDGAEADPPVREPRVDAPTPPPAVPAPAPDEEEEPFAW